MNYWLTRLVIIVCVCLIGTPLYSATSKPNIFVLATGGGIAGALYKTTNTQFSVANLSVNALLQQLPELDKLAHLSGEQISQVGSQAMTDIIWLKLAKRINKLLDDDDVDGIVITHGTDTIEETAYFLNLVVRSRKPVVLVGATRPYNHLSPDGPSNLYDAVSLAVNPHSMSKGVLIAMNGLIIGARGARKIHTYSTDSIRFGHTGFMGYIYGGKPYYYQQSTRKHTYRSQFDISKSKRLPRVDIVYGYANSTRDVIDSLVRSGAKGIVFAGVGNGNVHPETMKGLINAQRNGVQIVRSSRTGNGMVTKGAEIKDDKYKFVVADNLSPQKARILLMLCLSGKKHLSYRQIQQKFNAY